MNNKKFNIFINVIGGAGSTTLALMRASMLANEGKNVLLVTNDESVYIQNNVTTDSADKKFDVVILDENSNFKEGYDVIIFDFKNEKDNYKYLRMNDAEIYLITEATPKGEKELDIFINEKANVKDKSYNIIYNKVLEGRSYFNRNKSKILENGRVCRNKQFFENSFSHSLFSSFSSSLSGHKIAIDEINKVFN